MRNHGKRTGFLRRGILVCIAACFTLAASGSPKDEPRPAVRYRVTDLGTLPGCDVTYATAVNDAGTVVGYAYTFVAPGHGNELFSRPIVWCDGTITELPSLGGKYGKALTINATGDVGGYANTTELEARPVLWRKANGYEPETLSSQQGGVRALMDDGTAVGDIIDGQGRRSVLWQGGKMRILGNARDVVNCPNGVNSAGIAVGYFVKEGGKSRSAWTEGDLHAATWANGRQIALPEPGGRSECLAINERGEMVGWAETPEGHRACIWKDGRIEALPAPKGYCNANAINREGAIVGECREETEKGGSKLLAYMWRNGKSQDLNKLIPANSGWNLCIATGISDSGLIVGYGDYIRFPSHNWRAFLLTPVAK